MIQLRSNPIEGSSLRLNLSFKDNFNNYYVPSELTYTILALNDDKSTWQVVDNIYKKELNPESMVTLTTPVCRIIEGTTLTRKILVEWSSVVDDTYTDFVDEVNYVIQPRPYVKDIPPIPVIEREVKIVECYPQIGSKLSTLTRPTFIVKTNVPVTVEHSTILINDIICDTEKDQSNTVLRITPNVELESLTEYELTISNLLSIDESYGMKENFRYSFSTGQNEIVQETKLVIVTENGQTLIQPNEGYTSMKTIDLRVNVKNEGNLYAYDGNNTTYYSTAMITKSGSYRIVKNPIVGQSYNNYSVTVYNDVIRLNDSGTTVYLTYNPDKNIL